MSAAPPRETEIQTARRALSDPQRVRIWEFLDIEPRTAKQLGAALGTMPNRLYYHLRILQAAGLVEVVGTQAGDRMVERVYAASHRNVGKDLGRGTPEERMLFFSSMMETTRTEMCDVIASQAATAGSDAPRLSLLRRVVQISPEGFDQLARRVREVVDHIEAEHPGAPWLAPARRPVRRLPRA